MAKATPAIRAFNGGEASPLMDGRADLAWYPSSLRSSLNCILTPQGPMISRSGTKFLTTARTDAETSTLVPFIFSNQQSSILEFGKDRIRFLDETGVQVYAASAFTFSSSPGDLQIELVSAGLNAVVGSQVVISGFGAEYNLNNITANVLTKVGTTYTLDIGHPVTDGVPAAGGFASLVYSVTLPYTEAQRKTLWIVQDADLIYLLVDGVKVRKLVRYDTYDWRLYVVDFVDGPYMDTNLTDTTLKPDVTGNAVPNMTTNTAPSGTCLGSSKRAAIASGGTFLGRVIPLGLAATDYFQAFNDDSDETLISYWASATAQQSNIEYNPAAAMTVNGYSIHLAVDNQDASYSSQDYAPRTWIFQGWNGASWVTLDKQNNYNLWISYKSIFFRIKKPASYTKYRLNVKQTLREGPLETRIGRLVMRSTASDDITLTASSLVGINADKGFQSTDVGRLVRVQGDDGFWRPLKIASVTSTTVIVCQLLGEPFRLAKATTQWRLGLWSDTTGYPNCATIYNERLYLAGPGAAIVGSVVGSYETMIQQEVDGTTLDDGAIVRYVQSERGGTVQWIKSDDKGLLIGTSEAEYAVVHSDTLNNYSPTAFDIRRTTKRGSAAIEPVSVDDKTLYVQRNGRTLREFTYTYTNDGYASSNKSKWASHLGVPKFVEMDYAAEPHSIVWMRRSNNTVVGMTYNPEENILGWHRHDFSGAKVESMAVIPQADQQQDMLWMQTQRTVNGTLRRYIEFMVKPWDFDDTLSTAHFVDCAIRYNGAQINDVYGLSHLEGAVIYGLADNKPIPPTQVVGGSIHLDNPASSLVLGLGYDSVFEISRIEAGTYEGAAAGKATRVNAVSLGCWATAYGEVGKMNPDTGLYEYDAIEFKENNSIIQPITLHTEIVGPITMGPGWDKSATVALRRPKAQPLPFNVTVLMPRMSVVDGD